MTGSTSPVGQVLGATTSGAASGVVLANTGNPVFQTISIGIFIVSIVLIATRVVKTVN